MSGTVKWGFGMAPLKNHTAQRNEYALTQVRNFVLGVEISGQTSIVEEISVVKGIFSRVIKQDQWDWFTVNMYLDYPSLLDTKVIVRALSNLRKALIQKDDAMGMQSLADLKSSNFVEYCDNYLSFGFDIETEEEYLYILSRREDKDILKIGMTTRNVQKRVNEINSATGVLYPYSARKVYKVKDCRRVERDIHMLLADYRIRPDREFFKISFRTACTIIEKYLTESNQGIYGQV